MIDVKKAMLDPTMMFKDPKDVVANDELTRDQKIEILKMDNVVLRRDPTRATRRFSLDARPINQERGGFAVAPSQ